MNWTTFLLTIAFAYLAYYGLNLLYDLLMTRRVPKTDSARDLLFFDEDVRPEIIEPADDPAPETETAPSARHDPPQAPPSPISPQPGLSGPIRSTGAVGLRELFNLAKDNLIEYTGAITY